MNTNNPLAQNNVIPAVSIPHPLWRIVDCLPLVQAGIQPEQTSREADKTAMLSRFAEGFLIIWIPACAGMTA